MSNLSFNGQKFLQVSNSLLKAPKCDGKKL